MLFIITKYVSHPKLVRYQECDLYSVTSWEKLRFFWKVFSLLTIPCKIKLTAAHSHIQVMGGICDRQQSRATGFGH